MKKLIVRNLVLGSVLLATQGCLDIRSIQPKEVLGHPHHFVVTAGDNQSVAPLTTLPTNPRFKLLDENNNPLPNVQVVLSPLDRDTKISQKRVTTDSNGEFSVSFTTGAMAVKNRLHMKSGEASLIFTATVTTSGNGTFAAESTLSSGLGSQPISAVVKDFNNDGYPDIAVANRGTATVGVFINKGSSAPGTFFAQVTYPVGTTLYEIQSADLENRGVNDLIVSDEVTSNSIHILRGVGDGTFAAAHSLVTTSSTITDSTARGLRIADLDTDGYLDIVYTASHNYVATMKGNGDGTFQSPVALNIRSANPTCATTANTELTVGKLGQIDVADVRSNGVLDLIIEDYGSWVSRVLLGDGSGGFGVSNSYMHHAQPYANAFGDFRGDGNPTWVVSTWWNDIQFLGKDASAKSPSCVTAATQREYISADSPNFRKATGLATGDFYGRGKLDVLAVSYTGVKQTAGVWQRAVVMKNNTSGSTWAAGDFTYDTTLAPSARPYFSVVVSDLNRDGKLDVVMPLPDIADPASSEAISAANGATSYSVSVFLGQ